MEVIVSGIYSDILSGILPGIYSDTPSGMYSDILSGILSGKSSDIPSGISSEIPCGGGPAGNTLLQRLLFGSGGDHCHLALAAGVRQGTL